MAGAVYLSQFLRPLGVRLPVLMAYDLEAPFPWLLLEWLSGKDLGAAAPDLSEEQLDRIAREVALAQAITARTGSAGRYDYAPRADEAPHCTWSQVLEANLARSRRRIASARLFEVTLVDIARDIFLLDLMSEHGQVFNGNSRLSTSDDRSALRRAVDAALAHTPLS
jgi:hypothetical protein